MVQIEDEGINIRWSDSIPYTWVTLSGMLTFEQVQEKLSKPELFDLLTEKQVENVLIDVTQTWRFGTEDSEWLGSEWANKVAAVGVKRVSLVVQQQVFGLFGSV